jgi:hypothetical protein
MSHHVMMLLLLMMMMPHRGNNKQRKSTTYDMTLACRPFCSIAYYDRHDGRLWL